MPSFTFEVVTLDEDGERSGRSLFESQDRDVGLSVAVVEALTLVENEDRSHGAEVWALADDDQKTRVLLVWQDSARIADVPTAYPWEA